MYSGSAALLHTRFRLVFRAPGENHGCAALTNRTFPFSRAPWHTARAFRREMPMLPGAADARATALCRSCARCGDGTCQGCVAIDPARLLRAAASSAEVSAPLRAADTAGAGGAGANQGGPPAREPLRQLRRVGRRRSAARTHRRAPSGACVRGRPPERDGALSSRRARALVCACAHARAGRVNMRAPKC